MTITLRDIKFLFWIPFIRTTHTFDSESTDNERKEGNIACRIDGLRFETSQIHCSPFSSNITLCMY
jgi:hypothetical protein